MFFMQVHLSVQTFLQFRTIPVVREKTIKDVPLPYILVCEKRKIENFEIIKYGFDTVNRQFYGWNSNGSSARESIEKNFKTDFDLSKVTLEYEFSPAKRKLEYEVTLEPVLSVRCDPTLCR